MRRWSAPALGRLMSHASLAIVVPQRHWFSLDALVGNLRKLDAPGVTKRKQGLSKAVSAAAVAAAVAAEVSQKQPQQHAAPVVPVDAAPALSCETCGKRFFSAPNLASHRLERHPQPVVVDARPPTIANNPAEAAVSPTTIHEAQQRQQSQEELHEQQQRQTERDTAERRKNQLSSLLDALESSLHETDFSGGPNAGRHPFGALSSPYLVSEESREAAVARSEQWRKASAGATGKDAASPPRVIGGGQLGQLSGVVGEVAFGAFANVETPVLVFTLVSKTYLCSPTGQLRMTKSVFLVRCTGAAASLGVKPGQHLRVHGTLELHPGFDQESRRWNENALVQVGCVEDVALLPEVPVVEVVAIKATPPDAALQAALASGS